MTDKICPFMTKGDRVELTGLDENGTKIITQMVTGTAQVPCFRDGCMAWYEAGACCHLIHRVIQ